MKLLIAGKIILIDDEDHPIVSRYHWRLHPMKSKYKKNFYLRAEVWHNNKRSHILMHRLIMGMAKYEVDHVNGDSLDNQKKNLRYCKEGRNAWNARRYNMFGYKGVNRYKNCKYYVAKIQFKGKREVLGKFVTPIEAARAYDARALELFGSFASLNFPGELT